LAYNEETNEVIISFNVTNKVWISNGKVVADFLWFLNAWHLDFINNRFHETMNGLVWQGILNDVPTTIRITVPRQPGVYEAWGEPYGHCHGHIWWPKTISWNS
jgi:hypothetical protein